VKIKDPQQVAKISPFTLIGSYYGPGIILNILSFVSDKLCGGVIFLSGIIGPGYLFNLALLNSVYSYY